MNRYLFIYIYKYKNNKKNILNLEKNPLLKYRFEK